MTPVAYQDIKALVRMTTLGDRIIADIAKAALSLVEGLRDAEIRAAKAEAVLAAEGAKLLAIRNVLGNLELIGPASSPSATAEMLREIGRLAA